MRPLRTRLLQARDRLAVPWEVVERDYLLSWILAGIAVDDELGESLAFKGGTSLKKCYFGDYRFSEDLDFTISKEGPEGSALESAINRVCRFAADLAEEFAPIEFHCERYVERDPHPGGQEAFLVRGRMPWHRSPQTPVLIEITRDEPLLRNTKALTIIHDYGETIEATVHTYAIEEIVAEKLRALLQHTARLEQRGWDRSRARDYYDLWRVLQAYPEQIDNSAFSDLLFRKCEVRGVRFDGAFSFFEKKLLEHVERTWSQWLGPLVPALPRFDLVVRELGPLIEDLLASRH